MSGAAHLSWVTCNPVSCGRCGFEPFLTEGSQFIASALSSKLLCRRWDMCPPSPQTFRRKLDRPNSNGSRYVSKKIEQRGRTPSRGLQGLLLLSIEVPE